MILRGLGIHLPAHHHSAATIAAASGVPEAIVRSKMGITRKTVAGPEDHTNLMGIRAAQAALADAGVEAGQLDLLISITEEHKEYPVWTAGIHAAHALGATRAYAFDIGQKCGSAVLGLKLARDLLLADADLNTILIAGGYRNSDLVDYANPATRFLNNLAAGGGAAVVTREGPGFEILGSAFITDGSFAEDVIVPVGGTREPATPDNLHRYRFHIPDAPGMKARMERRSLDNFTTVIEQACARSGLRAQDAAHLAILHMKRSAHEEILRRTGIPAQRTIYLSDYGHVGQVDPLLSLKLARDQGRLHDGDVSILCTAGIGYVWNALCVRLRK
ncbi:MAG: 3-oxoacyl-ACP synthase [Gammaproteobacteria bacterium]